MFLVLLASPMITLAGEAVFYPTTGRVNIPQLTIDGDPSGTVYSVDLQQRPGSWTFDLSGASLAISAPDKFTKEWLAGKTLYKVWLKGPYDKTGIIRLDFNENSIVAVSELSYGDYFMFLKNENYRTDNNGWLYIGDDDKPYKISYFNTDRYISVLHYETSNGNQSECAMLFFDKGNALTAVEFITEYLINCLEY
jgi:hypothetical protein